MRNWARNTFILAALVATAAWATPSQAVWVEDSLFAITDREVLILRTISDNHGYYQTEQTDTFLIIRDLATGRDMSHNIVERVLAHGEGATPIHYPQDNAYNPYTIRANMQAAPLNDPRQMYLDVAISDSGVRASDHDGVTHSAPWSDIIPMAAASLQASRDLLPILKMEGDIDLFDPSYILRPEICSINAAVRTQYQSNVDAMLVQLACDDEEDGGVHLIWFVLPAV